MNSRYDNNSFNIIGKYILVCAFWWIEWPWVFMLKLIFSWLSITRKPPEGGIVSQYKIISLGRIGKVFCFCEKTNTFEATLLVLSYNISWKRRDTKSMFYKFIYLCTKWCWFFHVINIFVFIITILFFFGFQLILLNYGYKFRWKQ